MFEIIISQILKMLLLMLLGCLCYRLKLIDQQGSKMLANLLLMVVNPTVAVMSMQTDYSAHLVTGLLISYGLAVVIHLAGIVISNLLIKRTGNLDFSIERFSAMYSNCGFIGIPLVQSIFGNEGVLYLTAYMTVFNIFSWTHGISLMTGKTSLKEMRKGFFSPMVIACMIGLVLFFLQIRLPSVLADSLTYVSGMNTPLAMIIAGVSVAQTDLKAMLKNKKLYLVSVYKLLLIPAIVLLALMPLPIPTTVACTILIASACPVAATCTAFALRFQKNYTYSSELYAFSTICSLVTVPLFVYAAERLIL